MIDPVAGGALGGRSPAMLGAFLRSISARGKRLVSKTLYRVALTRLATLRTDLGTLLESYSLYKRHDVFFVQIGACDGIQADVIHPLVARGQWSGILVEPVKYLFDELVSNYGSSPHLVFENCAIAEVDGVKTLHYLKGIEDKLPEMYKGMGTFDLRLLLSQLPPGSEQHLVSQNVTCCTLATLLRRNHVEKVDLLLIDAEGYDYQIIRSIDLSRIRPDILIYESMNLGLKQRNRCVRHLRKNGYCLYESRYDVMAMHRSVHLSRLLGE